MASCQIQYTQTTIRVQKCGHKWSIRLLIESTVNTRFFIVRTILFFQFKAWWFFFEHVLWIKPKICVFLFSYIVDRSISRNVTAWKTPTIMRQNPNKNGFSWRHVCYNRPYPSQNRMWKDKKQKSKCTYLHDSRLPIVPDHLIGLYKRRHHLNMSASQSDCKIVYF